MTKAGESMTVGVWEIANPYDRSAMQGCKVDGGMLWAFYEYGTGWRYEVQVVSHPKILRGTALDETDARRSAETAYSTVMSIKG